MTSLKKAFENIKKQAVIMSQAQSDFSHALSDSKYEEIELPDEVVDVVDYGTADMTYKEFIECMNEELKRVREES